MGGKHIWPELQRHIENLRGEAIEKVNSQYVPMLYRPGPISYYQ